MGLDILEVLKQHLSELHSHEGEARGYLRVNNRFNLGMVIDDAGTWNSNKGVELAEVTKTLNKESRVVGHKLRARDVMVIPIRTFPVLSTRTFDRVGMVGLGERFESDDISVAANGAMIAKAPPQQLCREARSFLRKEAMSMLFRNGYYLRCLIYLHRMSPSNPYRIKFADHKYYLTGSRCFLTKHNPQSHNAVQRYK